LICSSSRTTVFLPSESRCTESKPSPDRLCTSPVHRVRTRPPIAHIDCQRAELNSRLREPQRVPVQLSTVKGSTASNFNYFAPKPALSQLPQARRVQTGPGPAHQGSPFTTFLALFTPVGAPCPWSSASPTFPKVADPK